MISANLPEILLASAIVLFVALMFWLCKGSGNG